MQYREGVRYSIVYTWEFKSSLRCEIDTRIDVLIKISVTMALYTIKKHHLFNTTLD